METDVLAWYQLSSQGGHAGPGSSVPYIHQIELALALVSQNARPGAWVPEHLCGASLDSFSEVGTGLVGIRPPLPLRMPAERQPQFSREIGLHTRESIAWRVAEGLKFQSIASEFSLSVELVGQVVEELVQAMVMRQFVKQDVIVTPRKQCLAITAHVLWARAAKQEKFHFFAKHLDFSIRQKSYKELLQIWQDWSICQTDEFLALVNPRPSTRLVALLLKLGATKRSLAITSMEGAAPLAAQIKKFELSSQSCKERSQRAGHRLVLTPRGVDASKASGATVSMIGLHWWMLLVGSFLIAVEEI